MGPWFVASALDCGTALVLIVGIALRKAGYLNWDQQHVTNLAKMLAVFVLVDLYFYGCDLLTTGYFGAAEGAEVIEMLFTGALAPFFWTQIALMVLAAVILVTPKLRTNAGVVVASAFTIAAVFCKRVQILVGGFQIANVNMADVANEFAITNWETGMVAAGYQGLVYWPEPIEFVIALGVIALGVLFLLLGVRYLPLRPNEK